MYIRSFSLGIFAICCYQPIKLTFFVDNLSTLAFLRYIPTYFMTKQKNSSKKRKKLMIRFVDIVIRQCGFWRPLFQPLLSLKVWNCFEGRYNNHLPLSGFTLNTVRLFNATERPIFNFHLCWFNVWFIQHIPQFPLSQIKAREIW